MGWKRGIDNAGPAEHRSDGDKEQLGIEYKYDLK